MGRRWWWAGVFAATTLAASWWGVASWRDRTEWTTARARLAEGRYAEARPLLASLARRHPGRGEVEYALGVCEREEGRTEAAVAAWRRVPDDSRYAGRAALLRARVALEGHRFAEAEPLLERALGEPGRIGAEARQSLALIAKFQGRLDEVRRLFREGFDRLPGPVAVLKELWDLDHASYPLEPARRALEEASRAAPEDDRVWLGRANVAMRSGDLDAAARLLKACRTRRPEDRAAWRATLALARSRGDGPGVREALGHLTDEALTTAEILDVWAWMARQRGEEELERAALRRRLDFDPADGPTLERLAELEFRAGRSDRAAELRARKAELDRQAERYRDLLFFAPEPLDHARELSRLAESLGLPFEARTWLGLALRRDPGDEPARRALLDLVAREPRGRRNTPLLSSLLADPRMSAPAPAAGGSGDEGTPEIAFRDLAGPSGLGFRYDPGRLRGRFLPETMGGGVALLDFDGDGRLDVYVVQGGHFPPDPSHPPAGDRLFRNRGDGTFEDVTGPSGLAAMPRGYGMGVTAGDVDGDGFADLFVTRWRSYALYRNRGDGTFEDATEAWGLGGDRDWPSSAALADLDGDGDLDLYVCHYLVWDPDRPQGTRPDRAADTTRYNNPLNYVALPDHLFRNDGGRFVDVTAESGIVDADGRGLGVVAADLDGDRLVDLYVANDLTANFLFRNLGGMRFEEVAQNAGAAGNAEGTFGGSMGVACGDLDGDGRPDLAVTNFYGDSMALYHALGPALFVDHTAALGLQVPTRYMVGWGVAFLDVDSDGRLDLALTNGHLDDPGDGIPYAMPTQLFLNRPDGRLVEWTERAGADWSRPRVGRALASGDLDGDGRVDVVLVPHDGPLAYLHNESRSGHWLTLALEGRGSNRDAVGAEVVVSAGGRRQVAQRVGGGSYQSASSPWLHFGLGESGRAESVEVRWPSGRVDVHRDLPADAGYRLGEGDPVPRPLEEDGSKNSP